MHENDLGLDFHFLALTVVLIFQVLHFPAIISWCGRPSRIEDKTSHDDALITASGCTGQRVIYANEYAVVSDALEHDVMCTHIHFRLRNIINEQRFNRLQMTSN